MSILYSILKPVVKAANIKKKFTGTREEFIAKAIEDNKKTSFVLPTDGKFHYDMRRVMGRECLVMKHGEKEGEKALLVIYGGGFIMEPSNMQINVGKELGKRTGRDVWIPHYPLCIDQPAIASYQMVLETYAEMLRYYKAENIKITGFSSGGAIGLGMFMLNNEREEPLPLPAMMVLSSPGACPAAEETYKKMEELDKKDIMLPMSFMVTMADVMRGEDQNMPDYLIHLGTGDFSNFPYTAFFYGGDELLSAVAEEFEEGFKKGKSPYEMHIEPGMFHCYQSMYKILPESRKGFDEMVKLLM